MAKVDQLLKALLARQASALILVAGEQPLLMFGSNMEPLMERTIAAEHVVALLREILEAEDLALVVEGRALAFDYDCPGGRFGGNAKTSGGLLTVTFTPENPPEAVVAPAAEAPAAPPAEVAEEAGPFQLNTAAGSASPEEVMDRLLRGMVARGASDLHIRVGHRPVIRVDGWITTLGEYPKLSGDYTQQMLMPLMPERARNHFQERNDSDFAIEIPKVARFRANVFRDRHGVGGVFRQIPNRILTPQELGLSKQVQDLCYLSKGLVVVTGPTGSGKSTTLATLVNLMNERRQDHIITIEDPLEFIHVSKKCLVTQREVGEHTESFKSALRAALRMDPDIVLVGEMRDLETISIAIETAVTGHLVFGTLHTSTAVQTVDRIIDQFPADRQQQIRTMLADCLKAVIAQTLLRRIAGGRIAAYEVLFGNKSVSNMIREAKTYQLPSVLQTGKEAGMTELNQVLLEYVKKGIVDAKEAYMKSVEREHLLALFEKNQIKTPFLNG